MSSTRFTKYTPFRLAVAIGLILAAAAAAAFGQVTTTPLSSGSGAAGVLPAGATADYSFLQGTGTTVTDATGSGNNATLGGAALLPIWGSTGLNFTAIQQGVSLPAALNGTQTFLLAAYINTLPLAGGFLVSNQYPVMVSSSGGATGFNLMYNNTINNSFMPSVATPLIFANGSARTYGPALMSGFHVLGVVLGTGGGSLDHLYIDGTEVPYTATASSAGLMTSGNLYLGSSNTGPWSTSGFNGTVYRLRTYATQLSAANVAIASSLIRAEVASRGVAVMPVPAPPTGATLHAIGDSITYGYQVATPWPSLLSLANQPAYTVVDWGIPGITSLALTAAEPNRVATRCQPQTGPAVAILYEGTNDMIYIPVAGVWASIATHIQQLKLAGCKVLVGTVISRGGSDNLGHTLDADKNALDALILSGARTVGADGVVDFAANPLLGADGANANTTYFQSDKVHPTQAGQALLAAAASNALNYYFGPNLGSPTVTAAATYQMAAGDRALYLSSTSAQAITLPDCTGPSGEQYTVTNPAATSATITAASGQPINGTQASAPLVTNKTSRFTVMANPKAASGCQWAY